MTLLFAIQNPSVAIAGRAERFPVNRIYCVGRNYAAHAKEMGGTERESPFFFSQPANAVVENGAQIPYPSRPADLHHDVELVVALNGPALAVKGENLTLGEAAAAVYGYAVGLDFTRRDLQAEAKDKGRPWDVAKGFDNSAPLSALTPAAQAGDIAQAQISLKVNGNERQHGAISDLIWNIPELIAELSTFFRLQPGDLIFTGTPAGVAAVVAGDVLEGEIDNLQPLRINIGAR